MLGFKGFISFIRKFSLADFRELEELDFSTSFPGVTSKREPWVHGFKSALSNFFSFVFIFLRYSDERFMKVSEIKVSCLAYDSYHI